MTHLSFNEWIRLNVARLKRRIAAGADIDEDAFQDACLFMAEAFGDALMEGNRLERAFMAAYRRFMRGNLREMLGTCRPDETVMTLLAGGGGEEAGEGGEEEAEREEREELVRRIARYMRRKFPGRQVMVFEMKLYGFRNRDIEESLGITRGGVLYVTRRITEHLRRRFATTKMKKRDGTENICHKQQGAELAHGDHHHAAAGEGEAQQMPCRDLGAEAGRQDADGA